MQEVKDLLAKFDKITILSHINPDPDTIGTSLGIYHLLKSSKKVEVANYSKELPYFLDFLPAFSKIKNRIDFEDSLIICCDTGSLDRIGFDISNRTILNIDHHPTNTLYGDINIIEDTAASASKVAFELFEKIYPINRDTALSFYTALVSDTQNFTTSSISKDVFEVAYKLISYGVDPKKVAYNLTQRKTLSSMRIFQKGLNSLTLLNEGKIATVQVSYQDMLDVGATISDLEGIIEHIKALSIVEIAIFAKEIEPNNVKISMRSKEVDISKVVEVLGGGGHKVAAGVTIENAKIQDSLDKIINIIHDLGVLKCQTKD